MSFPFRKSPLRALPERSWAFSQEAPGFPTRAWACLPGDARILAEEGAAARGLVEKARAAGLSTRSIPAHWLALPTGLDLQVHLRYPGQPQKETLEGGLESALCGGLDSLVTMPNTHPFLDNPDALAEAIASASQAAAGYPVRVGFTASATRGMLGEEPTDIAALALAGAVAITDDGWGVRSGEAQDRIFAACAASGLLFQQHAEMPGHRGVATRSAFQESHKLPEYPRTAESEMVKRDIALLRRNREARYHVLHVSTRETLEEIRKAKSEGLLVTAEVTPHHLFFSSDQIPPESDSRSTFFKFNPPLFGPEDKAALRAALRDGTVDCVSTDHAPHEDALKKQGWRLAPFGTRGLETALPTLLSLVRDGELALPRLVEVFSTAPRRILGRSEFAVPTGLLFVNPAAETLVAEEDLPGVSRNSCFLGARLHGRIELRAEPGALYSRN